MQAIPVQADGCDWRQVEDSEDELEKEANEGSTSGQTDDKETKPAWRANQWYARLHRRVGWEVLILSLMIPPLADRGPWLAGLYPGDSCAMNERQNREKRREPGLTEAQLPSRATSRRALRPRRCRVTGL